MLWFSQISVMIGSAGLYGLAFSLDLSPAHLPRFCLVSFFRRRRRLAGGASLVAPRWWDGEKDCLRAA